MNDKLTKNDIRRMEVEIEYRKLTLRPKLLEDVKDYQGNAFDLPKFVDPSTGFISSRSSIRLVRKMLT